MNTHTGTHEEISVRVKELAMGFQYGTVNSEDVSEIEQNRLIGNAFDLNAVTFILSASLLLNSYLRKRKIPEVFTAPVVNESLIPQMKVMSHKQLRSLYGPGLGLTMLYGYRIGSSIGMSATKGLAWPLKLEVNAINSPGSIPVLPSPDTLRRDFEKRFKPADTTTAPEITSSNCLDISPEYDTFATAVFHSDAALVEDQQRIPKRARIEFCPAALPSPEGRITGDPWLDEPLLEYLQKENNPATLPESPSEKNRVRQRALAYLWQNNGLYRRMKDNSVRKVPRPEDRTQLIQKTHEGAAHFGEKRTLYLLLTRYWWPGIYKQVHEILAECTHCRRIQTVLKGEKETLTPLEIVPLFYRWSLDLLKFPTSSAGYSRVLVCVENLSRYAMMIPLFDKNSATVALAFKMFVLGSFGVCAEVVTDNGTEFRGEFSRLLEEHAIDHRTTSEYHAQANGLAERVVQVLKRALRKLRLQREVLDHWEEYVPYVMLAYNASVQSSIGLAPFTALYAQVPTVPPNHKTRFREPINITPDNALDEFVATELYRRMELVRKAGVICAENLQTAQHRDKTRYALIHSGKHVSQRPQLKIDDFVYIQGAHSQSTDPFVRDKIYQIVAIKDTGSVVLRGRDNRTTTRNIANLALCTLPNLDTSIVPPRDLACEVCKKSTGEETMLLCDNCDKGFHMQCLTPPLQEVPIDDWFCTKCSKKTLFANEVPDIPSVPDQRLIPVRKRSKRN